MRPARERGSTRRASGLIEPKKPRSCGDGPMSVHTSSAPPPPSSAACHLVYRPRVPPCQASPCQHRLRLDRRPPRESNPRPGFPRYGPGMGRGQRTGRQRRHTDRPGLISDAGPVGPQLDRRGTPCQACANGTYVERDGHDDMTGFLHCSSCGASTSRWVTPAR